MCKNPEETKKHCPLSTIVLHALPVTVDTKLSIKPSSVVKQNDSSHSQHSSDVVWYLDKDNEQENSEKQEDVLVSIQWVAGD